MCFLQYWNWDWCDSFCDWCTFLHLMRHPVYSQFWHRGIKGRKEALFLTQERGLGYILTGTARIKSGKRLSNANGFGITDISVLLLPCLAIGFTAWWALLPDQMLMGTEALSLFSIRHECKEKPRRKYLRDDSREISSRRLTRFRYNPLR